MSVTSEAGVLPAIGKPLLRVGEAAELLSVSRWTIYRWVEEGRLRGTKIGKSSLRIFRESIIGLIERSENTVLGALSQSGKS
ncbi:MAG TPA: helix-turn-helix domain-containing protein [Nitrospira sp.]|nr:helix-turn-helix domain-containing protein [Nitrospira sp.]